MSLCFSSYNEAYQTMFAEYKDIVSVKEASIMLNTGRKQIYKLLKQGKLDKLEHNAKGFLITKRSIVAYVLNASQEVSAYGESFKTGLFIAAFTNCAQKK